MQVVELPARAGFAWIATAWQRHFKPAPLAWASLLGAWLVVTLGFLLIPILGQVAANLLQPVFFAGFMLAARAQEQHGELPKINSLFAGFQGNWRPMIQVGAILFAGELLLVLTFSSLGFPSLSMTEDGKLDFAGFQAALEGKEWMIVLFVLLSALFKGALWFTPALLAFHPLKASHAVRWSVYAFLSNPGAMLCYGAGLFAVYFVALLPYGLGLIIAFPLLAITCYTSYQGVFADTAQSPAPEAPPSSEQQQPPADS